MVASARSSWMRVGWVVWVSVAGVFGCVERAGFVCAVDAECEQFGADGYCESFGACSIADHTCPSGRRLAEGAPDNRGGTCVATADTADASTSDSGTSTPAMDAQPRGFVPSNFSQGLLTAGQDMLEISADDAEVAINTDTGTIIRQSDGIDLRPAGVVFQTVEQSDGPPIGVFSATGLEIEQGAVVRAEGSAALAFAIAGNVSVHGIIDASGGSDPSRYHNAAHPGPGGYRGGNASHPDGAGPGGGRSVTDNRSGGGGGGHLATGGGGGGRLGAGGGTSGARYGAPAVTPLVGGSGGAAGGEGAQWGLGGGGGGAVQISARGAIIISPNAVIDVGGGGGGGGAAKRGGGGGGAGGAILLETGVRLGFFGTAVANGSGGGSGGNELGGSEAGGDGPRTADRATGGARPRMSGGGAGGQGGGAATSSGGDGEDGGFGSASEGGGGGGGAGGRIRFRCEDIVGTGVVSPLGGVSETHSF